MEEEKRPKRAKTTEEKKAQRQASRRLIQAARGGDIGGVRAALAAGGTNLDGAFREAALAAQDAAAAYLLDAGADPLNWTLIDAAARANRPSLIEALLDRGAPTPPGLMERLIEAGRQPLAEYLLRERGYDPARIYPRHRQVLRGWLGPEAVPVPPNDLYGPGADDGSSLPWNNVPRTARSPNQESPRRRP